jgi:hypothetical protein
MEDRNFLLPFFDEVEQRMALIRSTHGTVSISRKATDFVLDGEQYTVTAIADGQPGISVTFWLGLNMHRLHFITYLNQDKSTCEDRFAFCFGGAKKVGWEFFFEPLSREMVDGCSIWGTCNTDAGMVSYQFESSVTDHGRYWACDIAMMVQSLLRTAERFNVACMDIPPEPL